MTRPRVITEWYTVVRMFWRAVGPCTRTVPVRAVFFCGRVIFHSAAKAETIDRRGGRAIAAPSALDGVEPGAPHHSAGARRGSAGSGSTDLFSRALWRSNVDRK